MSDPDETDAAFQTLTQRQRAERARLLANAPKKVADVLGQLMTRRGYGRLRTANHLMQAWQQVAGQWSRSTRVGKLRRGILEVIVSNSVLATELSFARNDLVAQLRKLLPDLDIRDVKFRAGSM